MDLESIKENLTTKLLSKKERKILRRKQRIDDLKKLRRLFKMQKIVLLIILIIIVVGGLYIIMAVFGYTTSMVTHTLARMKLLNLLAMTRA